MSSPGPVEGEEESELKPPPLPLFRSLLHPEMSVYPKNEHMAMVYMDISEDISKLFCSNWEPHLIVALSFINIY